MAIVKHSAAVLDGSNANYTDREVVGVLSGVANAAGSADAPVSTAVTFAEQLPPNYAVAVTPSQAAAVSVSSKTSSGFNVVLTPLSGNISAGTFDVIVYG